MTTFSYAFPRFMRWKIDFPFVFKSFRFLSLQIFRHMKRKMLDIEKLLSFIASARWYCLIQLHNLNVPRHEIVLVHGWFNGQKEEKKQLKAYRKLCWIFPRQLLAMFPWVRMCFTASHQFQNFSFNFEIKKPRKAKTFCFVYERSLWRKCAKKKKE